jgi:D-alanyl-lipoteichoic acid acyltransferase DltB (MBOAT superfamily)
MRDYIYSPLGGTRVKKSRMYFNNLVTMLIAGLWHGASWMFVVWGGLHGIGLIVHKMNKPWLDKLPDTLSVRLFSWILTFSYVAFLWIFFRAPDMSRCLDLITHIGNDFDIACFMPFFYARKQWCIFIALIFLLHAVRASYYDRMRDAFVRSSGIVKAFVFLLVIQLVLQFGNGEVQPFIYFQF